MCGTRPQSVFRELNLRGFVGLLKAGLLIAGVGGFGPGGLDLVTANAQSVPKAPSIEFREWLLEEANEEAVEAMFRAQFDGVSARFGERLEFVCFAYAYGRPTPDFFARFADLITPIKGRLNCSPYVGEPGFSVLIDLAHIRCKEAVCSARSGISFGETIESSQPIDAFLREGKWIVPTQVAEVDGP